MSATRDKSQKFTFLFSNLYQIHRQNNPTPKTADGSEAQAPVQAPSKSSSREFTRVLKTGDLNQPEFATPKVDAYQPVEFLKTPVRRPNPLKPEKTPAVVTEETNKAAPTYQNPAIKSLKNNLQQLDDLHSRLKFMLKELEDLVKEE